MSKDTITLPSQNPSSVLHLSILDLILQGFTLENVSVTIKSIDAFLLKSLNLEMMMTGDSYGEMVKGKLKEGAFPRSNLKLKCRLLCDFMQKVFLSHSCTFDYVTPYKFKMMVVIVLNLEVNWERVLLKLLKDESELIVDKEDGFIEVKKSLKMCTKIYFMILKKFHKGKTLKDAVLFNVKKLMPKDQRYLEMTVGIANELFAKTVN